MKNKIILAVTGASGAIYAQKLMIELSKMQNQWDECNVIFSETAQKVWEYELQQPIEIPSNLKKLQNNDFFAAPASGSACFNIMIVCPCSMGTLSRIANGISSNLIERSADVMLKERRKLIMMVRENPFNQIHLENMQKLTQAGAIIGNTSPSFYSHPKDMESLIMTVIEKTISLSGLEYKGFEWKKN